MKPLTCSSAKQPNKLWQTSVLLGLAFVLASRDIKAVDLAQGGAAIVAAPSAAGEAARLAEALKGAGCGSPEVVPDTFTPTPGRPLIVLGNAPENRLIRQLYFEDYDFADYAFPGPGNASVRTIPDPFYLGADVVAVEASDDQDLALAVNVFAGEIRKSGCKLGYLNRVVAGPQGRIEDPFRDYLDPSYDWEKQMTGAGSWDYMMAVARCGVGYLETGNEAYLPLFRDHLLDFYERRVIHQTSEVQIHDFVHWLVNTWDLVRPHPFFDSSRQQIDQALLAVLRSKEGPAHIADDASRNEIRYNHGTRCALDAYFGGRWAWRRLELPEGKEWMAISARYFEPQLHSSKPGEDSWGHQWAASLANTATYALAIGDRSYFQSEALHQAAMRALIAHSHLEHGPQAYLSLVAAATGDPRYLSLTRAVDPALSLRLLRPGLSAGHGGGGEGDEFLRAFAFYREVPFDARATGVAVAPLDRFWYDKVDGDSRWSPAGAFVRTVPFEDTFDKICIREGYHPDDLYLLLDGISGGGHAFQDANCIKSYTEGGVEWLTTGQDPMTVRQENGVYIAVDGAGPGQVHRYARKLYAATKGENLCLGAALTGLGKADWERHIVRHKGQWTLVIDRAVARAPGELLLERHWWLKERSHEKNGWLVSEGGPPSNPVFLHLQTLGADQTTLRPPLTEDQTARPIHGPSERLERLHISHSAAGDTVEIAALLYVDRQASSGRYHLVPTREGWMVEGAGERVLVGCGRVATPRAAWDSPLWLIDGNRLELVGRDTAPPPLTEPDLALIERPRTLKAAAAKSTQPTLASLTPHWHVSRLPGRVTAIAPAGSDWAAGDAAGNVVWKRADGTQVCAFKRPSAITALHFYPGGKGVAPGLCVGEEDSSLSLVNADGTARWSQKMPWIPMQWAYWTEWHSRAREIDTADLEGNGTPEILAANSDRHLWAFDSTGRERFRAPVEWGVFTGMTVAQLAGQLRILGGTSHPSIFGQLLAYDPSGAVSGTYTRPDLRDWSFPSSLRDVRVANLDDGKPEVIIAVGTSMRQLVGFHQDGTIAWQNDVAGGPTAIARMGARIICATESGYILAFDGAGRRQWSSFIGEPARFLAVDGHNIEAITDHELTRFDSDGKIVGKISLPSALVVVPRPGDERVGERLLLGLQDGSILTR
jgi:hypothetical protein